jgi:hypothetical protein
MESENAPGLLGLPRFLTENHHPLFRKMLYQVSFTGGEKPMPYGWATGSVQVTAAIFGPSGLSGANG